MIGFAELNKPNIAVHDDFVVRRDGKPVGILNPGTILGREGQRIGFVIGPNGLVKAPDCGATGMWEALCAAGSVLQGSESEVQSAADLIARPETSRTASYLCAISQHCSELLEIYRRLRRTKVAIAGCGGIGSLVAVLFAGIGVRRLTVVDPDVVEVSNLNRQLFWSLNNVGEFKIDVLRNAIAERYPTVSYRGITSRVTKRSLEALIRPADVVVLCADEPLSLVSALQRAAEKAKSKILISAGYLFDAANVTLHGRRVFEGQAPSKIRWETLKSGVMPSFGPSNAELAGRVVALAVRALAGKLVTRRTWSSWRPGQL